MIVGYADDHNLLKIIRDKSECVTAASQLNDDWRQFLSLVNFGKSDLSQTKCFHYKFLLKCDLFATLHSTLTMDDIIIPETNSIKVLKFHFDSLLITYMGAADIRYTGPC